MATAAGEMHLLDIYFLPCAYIKEVIEGSWKRLQEGTEKGSGRTLYGFKVYREIQCEVPININHFNRHKTVRFILWVRPVASSKSVGGMQE